MRIIDAIGLKQALAVFAILDNKKTIEQIIDEQPTIEPKQRWIPCSERLPEGGYNIIFCDSKGNVCEGVYHAIPGQWVGFRWNSIYHHDDVIAWMYLPKPYGGEE